jgi:hypothetical protein
MDISRMNGLMTLLSWEGFVMSRVVGDILGITCVFPNGYGVDVVWGANTYGASQGLWELAVVKPKGFTGEFEIIYDTPITDDVIGYLDDDEVVDLAREVKALPARGDSPQ